MSAQSLPPSLTCCVALQAQVSLQKGLEHLVGLSGMVRKEFGQDRTVKAESKCMLNLLRPHVDPYAEKSVNSCICGGIRKKA